MSVKVGLIGVGTVGSGVVEILESRRELLSKTTGVDIEVSMLCARTQSTLDKFPHIKSTTNPQELIDSKDVDIVVELAGGYDAPREWLTQAITAGKHVVTANKALVAKYGTELLPLASSNNLHFLFEAAVGGGIPIIKSITESMQANTINSLSCIINGTCNYILSEMSEKGSEFDAVLKEAQDLGYAEADPTFDVEGIDASHKLAILASLASFKFVDFEKFAVKGIRGISKQDIQWAAKNNFCIKHLGSMSQDHDGLDVSVEACLLPSTHLLANVNGALNAVYIETDRLGPALFTGAGAGQFPTASAVVSDIFTAAHAIGQDANALPMDWYNVENPAQLKDTNLTESEFYIRLLVEDKPGVLAKITKDLSNENISLATIQQTLDEDKNQATIIVTTHLCKKGELEAALAMMDSENIIIDASTIKIMA
ncbi:homoserine dehydrogenase [Fibrobacterales bacterium]|nr:homoserine dehydrogenase [Fibrobacterales bacterium]